MASVISNNNSNNSTKIQMTNSANRSYNMHFHFPNNLREDISDNGEDGDKFYEPVCQGLNSEILKSAFGCWDYPSPPIRCYMPDQLRRYYAWEQRPDRVEFGYGGKFRDYGIYPVAGYAMETIDHPETVPSGEINASPYAAPSWLIHKLFINGCDPIKGNSTERNTTQIRSSPSPRSPSFQTASVPSWNSHSTRASPTVLTRFDGEPYMRTSDAPDPTLFPRWAATVQSSEAMKEQTMTLRPLLLPPSDKTNVSAHRLASLYFEAIIDSRYIPEFRAEYISDEGQTDSILLTLKNARDADRLKEMWDSTDRGCTRVPELAHVSLNRGDTSTKRLEKLVQSTALEELASYRLVPHIPVAILASQPGGAGTMRDRPSVEATAAQTKAPIGTPAPELEERSVPLTSAHKSPEIGPRA